MSKQHFEAVLERPEGTGTWTYFAVPFNVESVFGSRSQVKVKGTVNGIPYRSSLMPGGDGTHYMVVNGTMRKAAGVSSGSTVDVLMEIDDEARIVTIPEDLANALYENEAAGSSFEKLSFSHKKEYVEWIEEAKRQETRVKRIQKAIEKLSGGDRLR